jgi:putative redox protein
MYAKRKGWDIGTVEVSVDYTPAERGCPTKFSLDLRLPAGCTDEQRERLQVIAAKCPVHRTLEGEVMFEDRVTITDGHAAGAEQTDREPALRDVLSRS